jgi:hypothetical protein
MTLILKKYSFRGLHHYFWDEDNFRILVYVEDDFNKKTISKIIVRENILNFLDDLKSSVNTYTCISDGNPTRRIEKFIREIKLKLLNIN